MSELMNTKNTGRGLRRRLLTTVSALALLASVNVRDANAANEDADRPTVWIELGGEMEHITGQGDAYSPGFLTTYSTSSILQQKLTPTEAQNPPPFSFGGEGKISFQPDDSNWVISASVRYGRSNNSRQVNHQTTKVHYKKYASGHPKPGYQIFTQEKFADTHVYHHESHSIMDFVAGKDVGLGMFGLDGSSVLSGGVRIAQFSSHSSVDMRARPDLRFLFYPSSGAPNRYNFGAFFHTYHAYESAVRNFRGIGPTISWTGSMNVAGNHDSGVSFDWGGNAALLFGRQIARVRHQETGHFFTNSPVPSNPYQVVYQNPVRGHTTDRAVIVPNLGGFAGLSYRYNNAKISFGYRADVFFGAIDGGIDTPKSETLGFYGPFATISVGLP